MNATQQKTYAAVRVMIAIGEAVRESGTIPSGHLYAAVCGRLSLSDFELCLGKLQEAGLVRRTGDLLKWVGKGGAA